MTKKYKTYGIVVLLVLAGISLWACIHYSNGFLLLLTLALLTGLFELGFTPNDFTDGAH